MNTKQIIALCIGLSLAIFAGLIFTGAVTPTNIKPLQVLAMIFTFVVFFGVAVAIFKWLWNSTVPTIFKISEITFGQAFRLLLLANILLGGGIFRHTPSTASSRPVNVYVGQPPYELQKQK
jgi:hypothetical protein